MRKLTTIILLLCALVVGAQAAIVTLGPGGDVEHLEDITGQISSGDTIEVLSSYNDSSSTYENLTSINNVTWDLNGYTITFVDASNIYTAGLGQNWTIKDGTLKYPRNIGLDAAGVYTLENLDVVGKLIPGFVSDDFFRCGSNFDSLIVTNCSFSVEDTTSQYLSWIKLTVDGYASITDSDFSGAGYAFRVYGVKSTTGIEISGCTFSDQYNISVEFQLGGNPTISACEFSTTTSDTEYGLFFHGGTTGTQGAIIDRCTFTDSQCFLGSTADTSQGDSITVSNNIFTGTNVSTILTNRINYADIYGNTFYGSNGSGWGTPTNGPHVVAIGYDGGTDVGEDDAAYGVRLHDNTFSISKQPTHGTPIAYYPIVVKAKGTSIYNNTFEYSFDLGGSVATPTFVHPKGATNLSVHNNEFICDDENISVFLFNGQGDSTGHDVSIMNNKILGTYENLIYFMADGLDTNLVFRNNYYTGNALADSNSVVVDATESAWYGIANFTGQGMTSGEISARLNWAGAPATGISPTPAGLYPIGIATASRSTTDPDITVYQPGFETPYDAAQFLTSAGQSGIKLKHKVRTQADLASAIYWTASYPADSTGTFASEFKGILEVTGAKD